MKLVFFTFYYPPDLSAGSFRAIALVEALTKIMGADTHIHIITTQPNRYQSFKVAAKEVEHADNITIHRVPMPAHKGSMLTQVKLFFTFARKSLPIVFAIKPDFIIGTSGRLMTAFLAFLASKILGVKYFLDIRDIFSESISDVFLEKSKLLAKLLKYFFQKIEQVVMKNAAGINVVSPGFLQYFTQQGIDTSRWSIFMNGIDNEFINVANEPSNNNSKARKTVVYAGNIGHGQGLEKIIPACAKALEKQFDFIIIGAGNTENLLQKILAEQHVTNVNLVKPVSRIELLDYYKKSDVFFIHLNDYSAFQRVLPSKIFEYAALGKPIVAGLAGYSAAFLKAEVPYSLIFTPGCVAECIDNFAKIATMPVDKTAVDNFIFQFAREKIMHNMATHILQIANKSISTKTNIILQTQRDGA